METDKGNIEEVSKEKEKQDASSNRYDSLPPIVQNEMLVEQELQGNPRNPNVFRTRIAAGKDHGGFDWDKSALGEAWASALIDGKVNKIKELVRAKYEIRAKYEKEEEPIKSEFDELPEFVVSEMLAEQLRQTGKINVDVFKKDIRSNRLMGGFNWRESIYGFEAWYLTLSRPTGTRCFKPLRQAIDKICFKADEGVSLEPKSGEMIRRFPSGAVRSDDAGKPRFDYISPYSLEAIAEYFTNSSGDFGATNYFKGIPVSDIIPSLFRHVNALHKLPEGDKKVKYELQAIASNAIMALHTISLIERGEYKEVYDKTELIDKEGFLKEQGDK